MDRFKKVLWRLLFPHPVLIFILVNASIVLLLYAFLGEDCPDALAYASYAISAYALTVVCARVPAIVKKIRGGLYSNRHTNRLLTDKELRIRISLYGGLVINICFAIFKVIVGTLYQSKWLYAMAGYLLILSIMRFILVYRDRVSVKVVAEMERRRQGLHSYKVCGWLMLLLNSAISVIVVIVVVDNQMIDYPGFMIYAIAAYTFYCLTMAIINLVKYWHRINPVFSAVKRIGMAKALVAIFTLQVAMITQFGDGTMDPRIYNGLTGVAVCTMILVMAVLMIAGVKKDYKGLEMRIENEE